jgi:hypothetical protein
MLSPTRAPNTTLAATIDEAVENLLLQGWTRLTYPALGRSLETLVEPFIRVTTDPSRSDLVVSASRELDRDKEPDIGLIENAMGQVKPNPRPDEIAEGRTKFDATKFKHQFKPRLLGYVAQHSGAMDRHGSFLLENARVYGMCSLLMLEIAEALDRQMPGYNFVSRMRAADHYHLLRLLRYVCDGPFEIARPHRDQNFISAQIGSDRGGLWLVDSTGRIVADAGETDPDSILIFWGRKMWQMTGGKIQGIIHGVKDTTHGASSRIPRHTAVFFGHVLETTEEKEYLQANAAKLAFPDHVKAWAEKV